MNTKETIISLLLSTKRDGIEGLIAYMESTDYFTAPASSQFHGVYPSGLAEHHLEVYKLLSEYAKYDFTRPINFGQKALEVTKANIIIAALTHDFCKIKKYYQNEKGWQWDRKAPKGHAMLSIERVKKYIKLDQIEEMMIRYHMGMFSTTEYNSGKPSEYDMQGDISVEYDLTNANPGQSKEQRYGKSFRNATYHNPVVKFIHICDEIASHTDRK